MIKQNYANSVSLRPRTRVVVRRRCRRRRRRTLRRTSKNHYGVWVMWVRRLISAWGLIISFFDVTENLFPANTVFEERVRARAVRTSPGRDVPAVYTFEW